MKQINYPLLFISLLLFSSCGTLIYKVTGKIENSEAKVYLPEKVFDLQKSEGYQDSIMQIKWIQVEGGMGFELLNKSNYPLKIVWDEAVYVDYYGNSINVIHGGIRYVDMDTPMKLSAIPPGAYFKDEIIPTEAVHWTTNVKSGTKSWRTFGIAHGRYFNEKRANEIGALLKDNGVSIMLPIDYKGQMRYYHYYFDVTSVKIERTY